MRRAETIKRTVRNNALWNRYVSTLKKYGEHARKMTKESIYEEVGAPFFLLPNTVQRIISKMLKDKTRIDQIKDDEELNYIFSEMDKMQRDRV